MKSKLLLFELQTTSHWVTVIGIFSDSFGSIPNIVSNIVGDLLSEILSEILSDSLGDFTGST